MKSDLITVFEQERRFNMATHVAISVDRVAISVGLKPVITVLNAGSLPRERSYFNPHFEIRIIQPF